MISIHAPRVGSDSKPGTEYMGMQHFNPRSPCGERLCAQSAYVETLGFQSTLPVWGATTTGRKSGPACNYFNPRSPCGERLCMIAAPATPAAFQSTLPVWGATTRAQPLYGDFSISIHAPRVGSDPRSLNLGFSRINFNPRSPCGERLAGSTATRNTNLFQSTLPVWGATS